MMYHHYTQGMTMEHISPIQYCQEHSVKLTPLRQQVLNILQATTNPLTAYAILDILKESNPKAQVMSVYRILDFLQTNGLVHRIENLNAFMACRHLADCKISQWLICESCGIATEFTGKHFQEGISHIEQSTGFQVKTPTIELLGVCSDCTKENQ